MQRPTHVAPRDLLEEILDRRILLLDGSLGAYLYSRQLEEEDYRGQRFRSHPAALKNCVDVLTLTHPEWIEEVHRAYLDAGADILETNTFNANAYGLAEFGLQEHVVEV